MLTERELAISPLVPESLAHNAKTLSNIRHLTSSLFGVAAGILGLESYAGFAFYLLGTTFVSALVWALLGRGPGLEGQTRGIWTAEVLGGLSGYVLTWTLFFGLVRA
ncbi:MAG: hypothetical protein M1832_001875 [Thelocarpon impressellum]|nr:MAG: hypothetical protein M1832_001875 [Thelocarpon impressellum]